MVYRNYLRGEYTFIDGESGDELELPPRARRILSKPSVGFIALGTTSACAENTMHERNALSSQRNYLRVRGEYLRYTHRSSSGWELPPRARRIHGRPGQPKNRQGTTSACAENTGDSRANSLRNGNYLRVRGEYWIPSTWTRWIMELPPRARRIQNGEVHYPKQQGTTSACAENTCVRLLTCINGWNYLRVRGEYPTPQPGQLSVWELPPRARRILACSAVLLQTSGTTSACAENTKLQH